MSEISAGAQPGAKNLSRDVGVFLLTMFVVFAYGVVVTNPDDTSVRTLSLIFSSIMLEAMPFMLFGSLVGGLIEAFISRERMMSLLPKRGWVTVLVAAGMGICFPICECAVVPVVRRLARKGLPASAAIAYLLGGPIVNPIVAASTALACGFDWRTVALRSGVGYVVAVAVAFAMWWLFGRSSVFRKDLHDDHHTHSPDVHSHKHSHEHAGHEHTADCASSHENNSHDHSCSCGCGHAHSHADDTFQAKMIAAFRHAADDFVSVGHFLVIGGFIAALAQTYIDRKVFLGFTGHPVLPLLVMMALAIMLNLCSEADAFISASFRGLMPFSSQMAFMLTGPMFDLKLLLMYQTVFRKRAILALSIMILVAVFLASLCLQMLGGGEL